MRKLGRPLKYAVPPVKTLLVLDQDSWKLLTERSQEMGISRSDLVQLLIKKMKK
jgi:hypothetical protein